MITVVGSANMDLVTRVKSLPEPGETVLANSLMRSPGGKGANQAMAARHGGAAVSFVGRIGMDPYGQELLESMAGAGIDIERVRRDEVTSSGLALIAVDDEGENSIVVVPGANAQVTPEDVRAASSAIEGSSSVILQLEIPFDAVHEAATIARAAGVKVILNPAPTEQAQPTLFKVTDVLVLNQQEIAALTGLGHPTEPATAARMLVQAGCSAVIVTMGAEGVVIVDGTGERTIPAFPARVADTTGAGDTFIGNLARALDAGATLDEAARFGSAAAALSVQRAGAQTAMPSEGETQSLLQRYRDE